MSIKDELADARLVAAWYATTHGDRLDHDSHCPAQTRGFVRDAVGQAIRPLVTCTCGWAEAGPALERLADLAYEREAKDLDEYVESLGGLPRDPH